MVMQELLAQASKPFEPVRQLRPTLPLVGELRHEQRERFAKSRGAEWTSIHRLEADVANDPPDDLFTLSVIARVYEARSHLPPLRSVNTKKYFAGDGVERGDDVGFRQLPRKLLRARRGASD